MKSIKPENEQWEIVYMGEIICFEVLKSKGFERAVRAPGVRMVLRNKEGLILLTKEFRHEQASYDFRLPGGKVFDKLKDYLKVRGDKEAIMQAAINAVVAEAKQEAGVDEIIDLEHISTSKAGATMEWDLFYFKGVIDSMTDQALEGDETYGIGVGFYTDDQILEMLKSKQILEDRSRSVLYEEVLKGKFDSITLSDS